MACSRPKRDVLSKAFEVVVDGVLTSKVPSLGRELGFSDVDMDAIKYEHPNDIMEQKRKMLSKWKERQGTQATPGELMEACRRAKLQDVADKIQKLIREDVVNQCEDELKEYYRRNMSFYTPLNWAPWMELDIQNHHVKARFKRVHRHEGSTKHIVKSEYLTEDELLMEGDSSSSRQNVGRVIIEGPPGIGKTTFLNGLVCAWVSGKRFTHQKLVFALKGRHLLKSGGLLEAILAQSLFPEDHPVQRNPDLRAHLWQWVEVNQDRVMFIIDGIAEIPGFRKTYSSTEPEHFVTKLIEGKILRHSNVLLTTTSIQMLDVSVLRWCDAYYTMEGFFNDDINRFVDTFNFKTRKAKADIKDLLGSNTSFLELCRIPMFLWFLCLIWDDNEHKSKARTVTSLLEEIVSLALRKALKGKEELSDEEQEKVEELCRLSWERTVSGDVCLMSEDIKNIKDLMLKSGFLVKEKSHRVEYTFGHTLYRQLFAAKHVVKFPDQTDLYERLWEPSCPSNSRYNLVCLFVAGLLGANAGPLFEAFARRYSNMLKDEECCQCCIDEAVTLACRCIVESRNSRSFGKAVATTMLEHMGSERELSINFYRKQLKLNTLLGLSYVIENINCMDSFGRINESQRLSLILDNLWIRNKRGLLRLGEAIMKTQCVHSLAISVTGLDASLLHPQGNDAENDDMRKFMQTIGSTQSNVAKLSLTAQIDRMSESAIRQVPKAFRNNEELKELDLFVSLFSKRCSPMCLRIEKESQQPCTKKERIQVFLTDAAEAIDNMKWLESLKITASILREDASRETIVPVLQRHEGITSLSVVGQVKGRGHLTLYGIQSLAMILEQNRKLKSVSVRLTTVSDDVKQREKETESPRDPCDTRAKALYSGLVKSTVTSIDLLFNCVLPREARLFADIVINNPHLTDVTFSWHTMFPSFLERLADAVEKSGTLKRLALCGKFGDGDSLVKLIRAALPANPPSSPQAAGGISSLFLQGQPFLDTTIDALVSCVKTETSLDRPMLLHLGGELFGPQAAAASKNLDALRLDKEASDDNFIIYHGLSVVTVDEEKPNVFHFETTVAMEFKRALRKRSEQIVNRKKSRQEETES
ncbi:PREDICTED: LOW QUALITY PROTEIN: uncharacterized protein LOC109475972 [Branchiostoma belcheri]|uniref:LOW QUALITY PROTEIN: uncharacterized protein LOC109475972 n=1 Tax=Branchiostoma belcheri TaxID=7741 RepID=A0A6P4ZMQ8_BRABE|nr:PREDICTED: LOW QUALITY PROTEIN: uncharacterized protein LOC109475972 [Branchiostoma belcheri]